MVTDPCDAYPRRTPIAAHRDATGHREPCTERCGQQSADDGASCLRQHETSAIFNMQIPLSGREVLEGFINECKSLVKGLTRSGCL